MVKDFYFDVAEVQEILLDNNKINELPIDNIVKQLLMTADKEMLLKNAELHMAKIALHKQYVEKRWAQVCVPEGVPDRGKMHDLSKWSPQELFESIYFFQGTRSPIDAANERLGSSRAFEHHLKNEHHLEASVKFKKTNEPVYETENAYINGGTVIRILGYDADGKVKTEKVNKDELIAEDKPLDVAIETICDFCAAAEAYAISKGEKFTFQSELEWWRGRLQVLQEGGTISDNMANFITTSLVKCVELDRMLTYEEFKEIGLKYGLKIDASQKSIADSVLDDEMADVSFTSDEGREEEIE